MASWSADHAGQRLDLLDQASQRVLTLVHGDDDGNRVDMAAGGVSCALRHGRRA
jgi:hypothetical protein